MTLTKLVPNGSTVREGDVLAEFDRTQQIEAALDAQARYDDLGHQAEQKRAQSRSDAEKRLADRQKAEADLAKARLQLTKGPLLGEIDRLKNEVKASDAEARVASLQKSSQYREQVEAAALRILELQRDRQKVAWERAQNNEAKMVIQAPLGGMVALENVWRGNSSGQPQEGDQFWTGQALLRIFAPTHMEVRALVAEADRAALAPGTRVRVRLDAYPEAEFTGRFDTASPVAASAAGSPIKTFAARFRLDQVDPRLLPDLSAAIIIEAPERP